MAKLTSFIEAQQLAFDIGAAIAEAEHEIRAEVPQTGATAARILATNAAGSGTDPHFCEVAALCHKEQNISNTKYVCGWVATDVRWCAKRSRLLQMEVQQNENLRRD